MEFIRLIATWVVFFEESSVASRRGTSWLFPRSSLECAWFLIRVRDRGFLWSYLLRGPYPFMSIEEIHGRAFYPFSS